MTRQTQLWRMSAKGGGAREVTDITGGISDFDLSPDGKRAVVIAEVGRVVGSKAEIHRPSKRIAFCSSGTARATWTIARSSCSSSTCHGQGDAADSGAARSLASRLVAGRLSLAYTAKERGVSDRDSNYEVFVQGVDAGDPKQDQHLQRGPDNDPDWGSRPAWSAGFASPVWLEGGDDKWIYYATAQLAVADVATGEVTRPARIDRWFYYPKFAPDGSILALVEQDRDTWLARIDPASGRSNT